MKPANSRVIIVCNLVDFLKRIGVINELQWYRAHAIKWGLLGRPDWIKR